MAYSPEDIQVTLVDSNGKSYTIDGFASDDFEFEQSWYRLCEVKEDGTHVVSCLDSEFNSYLVSFTEDEYNKLISTYPTQKITPQMISKYEVTGESDIGQSECSGGVCPIR